MKLLNIFFIPKLAVSLQASRGCVLKKLSIAGAATYFEITA